MQIIDLLCRGLDALEDKLTDEALEAEKEARDEEDDTTKRELFERTGYLRGMRDAYAKVRLSLEQIRFPQG